MYLPTRPPELATPFGCLPLAELSMMRGFCAAQAASTMAWCGCGGECSRLLKLFLLLVVVVLDAGDTIALGVGEHARGRAPRAHLGAGLSRIGEVGDEWVGERADRTADVAPAVVD